MRILWKCPWENGQVSFVLARSRSEAVAILEEIGAVDPEWLDPVDHRRPFFVTFQSCEEIECGAAPEGGGPHWHANDGFSNGVIAALGNAPRLRLVPPPEPEPEPTAPSTPAQIEPIPEKPAGQDDPTSE